MKGMDPIGVSALGKFLMKSKLPGKVQTVSKNEKPANMITINIIQKNTIAKVDLFIITFLQFGNDIQYNNVLSEKIKDILKNSN